MEVKIQKIKNRGVLFTANSGSWDYNIYLIQGKKNNFIIDTGLGSRSLDPVKEYLKKSDKETIVVNTHYHWDHIWGNGSFKDCLIVAHQFCREMIVSEWERMMQKNSQFCYGEVVLQLPNLVFQEELYFADDKVRLLYTPGHTLDSISVLDEEEGVLVLADNIGDSMEAIVPSLSCDKDVYKNTLGKCEKLSFDTCISGHNRVLRKDVVQTILNLL